MISDRTKQFIFNNLIKDLSNVEIIRHDESLWFIDREKKYWYLELVKTGKLYWRYQFFTEFFDMYSIDRDVYEPIIKEFVELVLNNGITSSRPANKSLTIVDSVLNDGVTSMGFTNRDKPFIVDSVLSNGITSTHEIAGLSDDIVDSVLTNGVTTKLRGGNATEQIKSVLKNGVKSTDCEFLSLESEVDSVLTNGVKTMTPYRFTNKKVMTVLNETVKDSMPLNAYRENMINYVLKDNPS